MNRFFLAIFAIGACTLHAQTAASITGDVKQTYTAAKTNLLKAADKMPEEDYSFKASPDIRTFGQLIAHIADTQLFYCGTVQGESKTGTAGSKTTKADIVAALKDSFTYCDAAYDAVTDASAADVVKLRQRQFTKLGILVRNAVHDNEEYGYLAVYMRIKGIVPPSSEGH